MSLKNLAGTLVWIAGSVSLAVSLAGPVQAGDAGTLSGEILGEVRNSAGVAQMGASVFLYNRFDQLVRRSLSNENGKFAFDSLAPDTYSILVRLGSFFPARRQIAVAAGSESRLKINLASILSS